MRIFYSHSFTTGLFPKVKAFRAVLDEAIEAVRQSHGSDSGSSPAIEVVEGTGVDFANPAGSIFPLIENSDILIAALFDETRSRQDGFVSAACLQEIIVAQRAGKKTMVWVEEGCTNRLGFIPHLTTYGEIGIDELLLADGRDRIARTIVDRLIGAGREGPRRAGCSYIYVNDFGPGAADRISSFEWRRAYVDEETHKIHFEETPRSGGQTILRACGENGKDCLCISSTKDTWNWALNAGQSLTT
jgi:hypothetical protein